MFFAYVVSGSFWSISIIFLFYINLAWLVHPTLATPTTLGNETDYIALLQFKESISNDPYGILKSWNSSSTHFCNWQGIKCSTKNHQRVQKLSLENYQLHGTISPYIGNLSFLRSINLGSNKFYGEIPHELCRLFRLRQLYLADNKLTGEFSMCLTNCSELKILNFSRNGLCGKLPTEIGSLKKLEKLSLFKNNFTGQIPNSIWNLSSLGVFSVALNNLEGKLLEEMGQMKNLSMFVIRSNKFSGKIPSSFYNMSSLAFFSAAENHFHGSLPANMFTRLNNLQMFEIGMNQLSGPIPTSISNASLLQKIDIGFNGFSGQVPPFVNLKDLIWLNLNYNNLGSGSDSDLDFITSLVNCTNLENLVLSSNQLGGVLPNSIGNFSAQLTELSLFINQIHGTIPATIGNNVNLFSLDLGDNQITGIVPETFGKFHKLQSLGLGPNHLLGEIPTSLGNLTQLVQITIANNMLQGKIPHVIGNWQNLQFLDFSGNNLSGTIPLQVFSLVSLSIYLNLSHNSFIGTLPTEVGTLASLGTLDISNNYLSGEIPSTIGECKSMEYLSLHGNSFNGMIPSSVSSLKGLIHLDLSQNHLSGSIPIDLQSLSFLAYLNLSFNMLEGEVPTKGVFKNASAISIAGNDKLCGGISELHLAECPANAVTKSKNHNLKLVVVLICVVVGILLFSILVICWSSKKKRPSSLTSSINQLPIVSYQILHRATEGFSSNNLIGSGSFGSVYRGFLESENKFVAIKVINLQVSGAHKSFIAECNALKVIRHRNLVKVLTCCSSIDYGGQAFKALVFEYFSNGSLEKWLHPGATSADRRHTLDLTQRLNVLIDVASALHYLHYECEHPIIHCDLKPSNVLLDDDMVAHVTDFGLSRLLSITNDDLNNQSSTIGLKGTIGYAPPEYGTGSEVSMLGDTYSFGILALEMLSGQRPTEEMFKDGFNLHSYVKLAYPNNILEIVESTLFPNQIQQTTAEEVCIFSLSRIALSCSAESPNERMNIKDVVRELNLTKNAFLCG